MFLDNDLRKALWPRAVRLMATHAEHCSVEFRRLDAAGIVRVRCKRAVARFAVNARMLPFALHVQNIRMTCLASFVSGEGNWLGGDILDSVSAIVAVLAEGLGYQKRTHEDEHKRTDDEDQSHAQQVFDVLEFRRHGASPAKLSGTAVESSEGAE